MNIFKLLLLGKSNGFLQQTINLGITKNYTFVILCMIIIFKSKY